MGPVGANYITAGSNDGHRILIVKENYAGGGARLYCMVFQVTDLLATPTKAMMSAAVCRSVHYALFRARFDEKKCPTSLHQSERINEINTTFTTISKEKETHMCTCKICWNGRHWYLIL